MLENKFGRIVNVSSMAGTYGFLEDHPTVLQSMQ